MGTKKKAVVLLSGGLDSATVLFYALNKGYEVYPLCFSYGQRHCKEIQQAQRIARAAGCLFKTVAIELPWKGSSLLDKAMKVPARRNLEKIAQGIPSTYVPARNIIFLSLAASYAETLGAQILFIGANVLDYSGYPDCRPKFFDAFNRMLRQGLKTGVEMKPIRVQAPLLYLTKAKIIRLAQRLKVPLALTWSCYQGAGRPCGVCDSCLLRRKGFLEANLADPLFYER